MMNAYTPKQSVELFHLLFLSHLGRKVDKKLYALKGGCNMRFYFNSIRYSEDMDIDIQIMAKETLRKNVNQILHSIPFHHILQARTLEILNVSEPKQTDTTQRWKVSLKSPATTLPLHTKIEFSRRAFAKGACFEAISPQLLKQYSLTPLMANHYSKESMYEQKILALALRKETQARDIFDLYFLMASGVALQTNDQTVRQHVSTATYNAKRINFSDFKGQVVAYLSVENQPQYNDEAVWESIVQTVITSLDKYENEIN